MQFRLRNLANVAIRYKIGDNPAANLLYVEKWGITEDTRCWMQDAGYKILDTRCWIQDTGYRILDTRCWIQDAGYKILDTGWEQEFKL